MVHSCLVLQHIPPEIAGQYIAEFFRVAAPGGLIVFQIPRSYRTGSEITAAHALPDSACVADLAIVDPPDTLEAGRCTVLTVRVTNLGDATWRHDIPAGRHICVGNHWRRVNAEASSPEITDLNVPFSPMFLSCDFEREALWKCGNLAFFSEISKSCGNRSLISTGRHFHRAS